MPIQSRTFRVFISSTFVDFRGERDALRDRVFPEVMRVCSERGFAFQPIDLRWGVTREAGVDQRTEGICLGEVRRCLASALRPVMLVLLGRRYGWRPLPESVNADDFEAIHDWLCGQDRDLADALSQRYKRDDHASPPEYYLARREQREDDKPAESEAEEVEGRLRRAMANAARELALDSELAIATERSLTEREIRLALDDADGTDGVLAYVRNDDNDLTDEEGAEARELSTSLVHEISSRLGANCRQYDASVGDGDDANLDAFCDLVLRDLLRLVTREMDAQDEVEPNARETNAHQAFSEQAAGETVPFAGRDAELDAIEHYFDNPDGRPLVVVGAPGVGKSALLARVVEAARRKRSEWSIVQRFVGVTPSSSDERLLLKSVCTELLTTQFATEQPCPEGYSELVDFLRQLMDGATADKPLLIVLDAIDRIQLDPARLATMVPTVIPEHVRFVVSVASDPIRRLPEVREYLQRRDQEWRGPDDFLAERLPNDSFLNLEGISEEAAEHLIDAWLRRRRKPRQLSSELRSALMAGFRECPLPLYLRIAVEEAAVVKSGEPIPAFANSLTGIYRQMFDRLARPEQHLPKLVKTTLAYLAASSDGLMESEILEVLSRDKELMEEVVTAAAQSGQPLERELAALPMAVWARLRSDLEHLLISRFAESGVVLDLMHQTMRLAVNGWAGDVDAARTRLIRYFQDQPNWLDSRETQTAKLTAIPPVPRAANLRKVVELPVLLLRDSASQPHLEKSLFDPDLLEALAEAGRIQTLIDFLRVASRYHGEEKLIEAHGGILPQRMASPSLFRLAVVVMAHKAFLERHPTALFQTLFNYFQFSGEWADVNEFLKRWRKHKEVQTPGFRWVRYRGGPPLHDVDTALTLTIPHAAPVSAVAVSSHESIIAVGDREGRVHVYRTMDGATVWEARYAEDVNCLEFRPDGSRLYAACWEGESIRELDAKSGTELRTIGRLADVPLGLAISSDGALLAASGSTFVYVWDLTTGKLVHEFNGHTDSVMSVCFSDRFVASGGRDNQLILWDLDSGEQVASTRQQRSAVEGLCRLSDDEHIATAHANGTIAVWKTPSLERVASVRASQMALSCIASFPLSAKSFFNSGVPNKEILEKWGSLVTPHAFLDLNRGEGESEGPRNGLTDWILVGSDDAHAYLWNPSCEAVEQFSGHSSHVVSTAWDPHSSVLCPVTGSHDNTVQIWAYPRLVDNREHGLGGRGDTVLSLQSQFLGVHAAWCVENQGLRMGNFLQPRQVETLLRKERPACCDFAPPMAKETVLAVGTETGSLILVSPDAPQQNIEVGQPVRNVKFGADGASIALLLQNPMLGMPPFQLVIVSYPEFQLVAQIPLPVRPGEWISGIAVSGHRRYAAAGGRGEHLFVFELGGEGGQPSLAHAIQLGDGPIMDLEFDLSGELLVGATGSVVGSTRIWNVQSGELVEEIRGYVNPRSIIKEKMSMSQGRARSVASEVIFELPREKGASEFGEVAWLPTSMSWLAPDVTGRQWIATEGEHVCNLVLEPLDQR